MTYIVASLVERSVSGVAESAREAFAQGADMVEVRLDRLKLSRLSSNNLAPMRKSIQGPAIGTLRSSIEGGGSRLSGRAREKALREIFASGFDYVDLELDRDGRLMREMKRKKHRPAIIASFHFKRPAPMKSVEAKLRQACKAGDIGKVAMPCEDSAQALGLAAMGMVHSLKGDRFALIGMGEQGQVTRVCARQMGSSMVYCSLQDRPAAPGQLDVRTQADLYCEDRVVVGLLGHPVAHSVSKPMQEAALDEAGLTGTYLNLDIPPKSLDRGTLETFGRLGFAGLNVTIPHKERIFSLCDDLGPAAVETSAVNTIKFNGFRIYGENTDVNGFYLAIRGKKNISLDASALVIGTGGAARAVVCALARDGVHVTVSGRNSRKVAELGKTFGTETATLDSLRRSKESFDIIVHCTPLGTKGIGGTAPVPAKLLKRGVTLFDLVYNPPVTGVMKKALIRGADAHSGLDMLVMQGADSFRLWTGRDPDAPAMAAAARRALE
jgi:shikimate dehydrogenase/3-dehydroquinate dehydratase type I